MYNYNLIISRWCLDTCIKVEKQLRCLAPSNGMLHKVVLSAARTLQDITVGGKSTTCANRSNSKLMQLRGQTSSRENKHIIESG